jgi:excisionase family DNA binding protein
MRNESLDGPLLNAKQVAKALNVSKTFAYTLMRKGEIPTVKMLGARRVRKQDLSQYINERLSNLDF